MRFGASVWPWKWDGPYDKAIARIGDAGFRATELIAWDDDSLINYYTPENVALLRGILDDRGMTLSQFVVKTPKLSSPDAADRASAVEMFKRGVDKGKELGATIINTVVHYPFALEMPRITDRPHVQVFTVDVPSGLDWNRNWADYIAGMKECASYAEQAGVTYSLEPHPFRYGSTTEGLLRILEAVDSPVLAVNFDPSHLFPSGDIPHVSLQRLGKRVVHCHFSDNDGETNVHWRPGKGKIDWEKVLGALKDNDFDGVVSLEFEDVPGVSRGVRDVPGVYKGNPVATEEFVEEYKVGLAYLTALATKVGIEVEL
jgi:sugar phosphate isomerase/epimerase